jgi:hypothetical protein
VRAYANIADELEPAGYGIADITRIKGQIDHYLALREIDNRINNLRWRISLLAVSPFFFG